jgi:UDP-glucose 4-epimerase
MLATDRSTRSYIVSGVRSLTSLVLGAAGFIGGRVLEHLKADKEDIVACDVVRSNLSGDAAAWMTADILDPLSLQRFFYDYDVQCVLHLIGLPSIEQCQKSPDLSFRLNVLSLQSTLEAMRKADVNKIVFISSAAAYGYSSQTPVKETDPLRPSTVYGYHKMVGEHLVRSYGESYGLKYVVLRLFNVYGGDPATGKDVISILIKKARSKEPLVIKGGNKFRDFVHVDDVAEAISRVAFSHAPDNRVFNVGTGMKTTLSEVANIVRESFSVAKAVIEDSADDGTGIVADLTQLSQILNFDPVPAIQGIRNHVQSHAR